METQFRLRSTVAYTFCCTPPFAVTNSSLTVNPLRGLFGKLPEFLRFLPSVQAVKLVARLEVSERNGTCPSSREGGFSGSAISDAAFRAIDADGFRGEITNHGECSAADVEIRENDIGGVASSVKNILSDKLENKSIHQVLETFLVDKSEKRQLLVSKEELTLKETLKQRRKCIEEILVEALRGTNLSASFCERIASRMPEFIDRVMVKAAALKREPKLANAAFSFRVRVYIDEKGVIKVIKWLNRNGLTAFQIGNLLSRVEDYNGVLQPVINWLKSINVRGRDLGIVLKRQPCILERSIEELNDVVELLEMNGVKKGWIGLMVRRSPILLSLGCEELQERVAFFTDLGINSDDFGAMVSNFPAVLGHFSLEEMQGKVKYLKRFGFESFSLGRVIAEKPQLLACSIEDSWKPLIKFLYYLGVDRSGLSFILTRHPSVFCLNLSENISPKVQYLHSIGVHKEEIGRLIVRFPALLSYSLDKKIKPLVAFLLETAGVQENSLGKVIALCPELIGCSLPGKLEVSIF
eukprot:c19085_g1_i3 orf=381-1952(+)